MQGAGPWEGRRIPTLQMRRRRPSGLHRDRQGAGVEPLASVPGTLQVLGIVVCFLVTLNLVATSFHHTWIIAPGRWRGPSGSQCPPASATRAASVPSLGPCPAPSGGCGCLLLPVEDEGHGGLLQKAPQAAISQPLLRTALPSLQTFPSSRITD